MVVSFPAYDAINQLFDDGVIKKDFVQKKMNNHWLSKSVKRSLYFLGADLDS